MSMAASLILDLRQGGSLIEGALVLAEYDLIVLEPSWLLRAQPGTRQDAHADLFGLVQSSLVRRREELIEFLAVGGLMVTTLEEPCTLAWDYHAEIDSYEWWLALVELGHSTWDPSLFMISGAGETALVVEPGHPFGPYLEVNRSYHVRLRPDVTTSERVTVLAENRLRQPVAAEISVGPGTIVLVPPPSNDNLRGLLLVAAENAMNQRTGRQRSWSLAVESVLEQERDAALLAIRVRRDEAEEELRRVRRIRDEALRLQHVARAVRYYERAIEGTPTPKRSLPHLYNLVEVVEHRLGGEAAAAKALQIPRSSLESIKMLANRDELDIRHAPTEGTVDVPSGQFDAALKSGMVIAQALIEYEAAALIGEENLTRLKEPST